ncbi:hypothetical protein E4U46_007966, partial [Claviceps purpurea]
VTSPVSDNDEELMQTARTHAVPNAQASQARHIGTRNELQHDKSITFDERGLWLRPESLTTRAQREQPAAALPEDPRRAPGEPPAEREIFSG